MAAEGLQEFSSVTIVLRKYDQKQCEVVVLQYWKSGRHPECTPLSYFINWAETKQFCPPWLPRAIEFGLYSQSSTQSTDHNERQKPSESIAAKDRKGGSEPPEGVYWILESKVRADRICLEDKEKSCEPSRADISKKIEKEFERDNILTVKGKRLTAEYILRKGLEKWIRPTKPK